MEGALESNKVQRLEEFYDTLQNMTMHINELLVKKWFKGKGSEGVHHWKPKERQILVYRDRELT